MKLRIKVPKLCVEEQKYILDVIFKSFLGIDYQLEEVDGDNVEISSTNDNHQCIIFPSIFFKLAHFNWLDNSSLPVQPLNKLKKESVIFLNSLPCGYEVPILFGNDSVIIETNVTYFNFDLFGSIFFMLTRYEELLVKEKDIHGRFQAYNSIAFKEQFLERPIVDEYTEILWLCLKWCFPSLSRPDMKYTNFITCDVDWPKNPAIYSTKKFFKIFLHSIIKARNFQYALQLLKSFSCFKIGLSYRDDYTSNLRWIMDVNEKCGNNVAFFFIFEKTSDLDSDCDFGSLNMQGLLNEIHSRGHEIGIHPGYECISNETLFYSSVRTFKNTLESLGIKQKEYGGRMHFLRWDSATTPALWDSAGLDFDSSLAYAEKSGFRCGTSKPFPMYDLLKRNQLKVIQRPLINMECSILLPGYEGLGYTKEAEKRFKKFKSLSKKYNGVYTLLWHNSFFDRQECKRIYKELIK